MWLVDIIPDVLGNQGVELRDDVEVDLHPLRIIDHANDMVNGTKLLEGEFNVGEPLVEVTGVRGVG